MEEIKNLFEALKEFIWDVIGYFLPGMYAIILVSVIVNPEYFIKTPLLSEKDEGINFITVILAYILGYVIYGISEAKENVRGKKSYTGKIEEAISKTKNYEEMSFLGGWRRLNRERENFSALYGIRFIADVFTNGFIYSIGSVNPVDFSIYSTASSR